MGGKYVLMHTGADASYVTDPRLGAFYEWLFASASTPFDTKVCFGDTANDQPIGDDFFQDEGTAQGDFLLKNAHLSAGLFSKKAQYLANRQVLSQTLTVIYPGEIIDYLTVGTTTTATTTPAASTVWQYGGAAFWDEVQSSAALMGVLNNSHTTRNDHIHASDYNGLYLAGYGRTLLSNVGVGATIGGSVAGFPGYYTSNEAHGGNMVLFGNKNIANNPTGTYFSGNNGNVDNSFFNFNLTFSTPPGPYVGNATLYPLYGADGITDSLVSNLFDYASGLSTSPYVFRDTTTGIISQTQGSDNRNFIFVHPDPSVGTNGYWIVDDEANAISSNTVNVLWHPYSQSLSTTTLGREYSWLAYQTDNSSTSLAIFLATPPQTVSIASSPFANNTTTFVGNYINDAYAVNASSNVNVVTILYPWNLAHPKSTFTALSGVDGSGTAVSGAIIASAGGITDTVEASSGAVAVSTFGVTFQGKIGFWRKNSIGVNQFFVRKGTSFNDGGSPRFGFGTSVPVSVHINGTSGAIDSTGTVITLYAPRISGASVDGSVVMGTQGSNAFTFSVPAGTHTLAMSAALALTGFWAGDGGDKIPRQCFYPHCSTNPASASQSLLGWPYGSLPFSAENQNDGISVYGASRRGFRCDERLRGHVVLDMRRRNGNCLCCGFEFECDKYHHASNADFRGVVCAKPGNVPASLWGATST